MSTESQLLSNGISFVAIAVFAITGVLAGLRKEADIFSLLVFGLVTALGGGTIRDLLLGVPVFWVSELTYVWVAVGAAVLTFFLYRLFSQFYRLLLYLDAIGVALFTIQAIDKVIGLGYDPLIAVIMGVITGIGGGLVRDVLTDRPTLLMTKDLYATPILVGSIIYLLFLYFVPGFAFSWLVAMALIFTTRAAAIYWDLKMPGWLTASAEV
ncbi:MAG: trimeric intracellular cation channel family protein [Anaerolineae bacterium]|nr:MAG: trimeric intracellular cation channel family protein [Anaerolineae bacterium]